MYPTELKRENNRKELLQEIEELQTEIKNLKAQILSAEKENKSLEAKVFELQTRMFKLETENKEELISLKSELADLRIRDRERANHSWKEQSEMLSLKEKEHSKMLRLKEERHSDMLRHKEKKHSEILRLKEEQHSASFRMKENDNIVGYWQGESSWSKNHLAELQNQLAMAKVSYVPRVSIFMWCVGEVYRNNFGNPNCRTNLIDLIRKQVVSVPLISRPRGGSRK